MMSGSANVRNGSRADIAITRDSRIIWAMDASSPTSVGLGGDGDELFAVDDVERAFGVKLDYADASHWHTAGDLFSSLRKALPADGREESVLWALFTEALSAQTGVDPETIEKDSPLLSQSRFGCMSQTHRRRFGLPRSQASRGLWCGRSSKSLMSAMGGKRTSTRCWDLAWHPLGPATTQTAISRVDLYPVHPFASSNARVRSGCINS